MRQLAFILLFIALPICGFAQSHTAADHVMQRFQKFYNNNLSDSIVHMFASPADFLWNAKRLAEVKKEYGNIKSYKYVTVYNDENDNKITLYKITSDKKVFMLGLTVEPDDRPGTFRFDTSSPYIDSLLKRN
jgi:hypothetical protein